MTQLDDPMAELEALQQVIGALQSLDNDARQRIFDAAATFLQIKSTDYATGRSGLIASEQREATTYPPFSTDTSPSPKEFLLEKQPRSDVERIAVLAYYLTKYRDTPHFKTLDLSKLNTEAAQPKFSNAANSANNAVKRGYIVSSTKGHRQLSAAGERFVDALPDREAARAAMAAAQPRRSRRRVTKAKKVAGG